MPKLAEILAKDIDRTIDGVVKADDDAHIFQEIDEYVLTDEVAKQLESVVEEYLKAIEAASKSGPGHPVNGVWISGYFGCGKSHLLKMLAYLMENREVDGHSVSDIFLPKVDDQILKGNLQLALKTPAKSILFNIEALTDAARKDDETSILHIFEKALNRMMGFYHENRAIAEFERHLTEEGQYDAFLEAYHDETGDEWKENRGKAFGLGRSKLIKALCRALDMQEQDARDLIDHYKSETSLSVEGFAQRILEWVNAQEDPAFRLNFFVDEVGQFIAGNVKLMLNLQTIAEELATLCKGRVWIFVTSQEDLSSVVGDPSKEQTNDFSKIHARFSLRISLSSADVQEVIEKRLLDKTGSGKEHLEEFYMKNKDAMKTVFAFAGGGKNIAFKDRNSFVASYPFQAYQYSLLQEALIGLSRHNAFMGRHVSRGERSMLEIFQDVSRREKTNMLFAWATFDTMFEGIRNTLRTDLLSAINTAERSLDNPLAVRILKALLLVKYVRDFKATTDHIKVLMLPDLETGQTGLGKEIEEALNLLEHQTYVERNGLEYQYLTDEEKDIEEEIKATTIETSEIRRFIEDIVFHRILKGTKIRVEAVSEDYSFRRAIDEEQPSTGGVVSDLTIRVVTPYHPHASDTNTVLNQSAGKKELLLFTTPDDRFMRDLRLYFQTDKYARQHLGQDTSSQSHRILTEKQHQNLERRDIIVKKLTDLMGEADVYVMDTLADKLPADPSIRISQAFQKLVNRAYPRLQCLQVHYTEQSLQKIIFPDDEHVLYGGDAVSMDEAQKELWTAIQRKYAQSERSTLSSVLNEFGGGQYGWYPMAILCVLAQLYMRGAIEIREGGSVKDRPEVYDNLRKNRNLESYVIRPAPEIGAEQIKALKAFHHEFFHEELQGEQAKECGVAFKQQLLELRQSLDSYLRERDTLQFLDKLDPIIESYNLVLDKEWSYALENVDKMSADLLTDKLSHVDLIVPFMTGSQREIWLDGQRHLAGHLSNLHELGLDAEVEELKLLLKSDEPYIGMTVKTVRDLVERLRKAEGAELKKQCAEAAKSRDKLVDALQEMPEFNKIDSDGQERLTRDLAQEFTSRIEQALTFGEVRDTVQTYGESLLHKARKEVFKLVAPESELVYANATDKLVPFEKGELRSEQDVVEYAEALKKSWAKLVKSGKRIGLT
jgi:hypothetical protein